MSLHLPSATITGGLKMTDPVNEPVRDYRPGSPEAVSLEAEIARVGGEVRELPHVINGERLPLTDPVAVTAPHDHAHVLGHYSAVDDGVVDAAIEAALAARADWSRTPWWDRAAVLLRAAELVSGKYRDELNATTMLGQSEDVPPGRDRRRVRDGRLLPLQRGVRRADLRRPSRRRRRGSSTSSTTRAWKDSCCRSPRSTSPRSARTCPPCRR